MFKTFQETVSVLRKLILIFPSLVVVFFFMEFLCGAHYFKINHEDKKKASYPEFNSRITGANKLRFTSIVQVEIIIVFDGIINHIFYKSNNEMLFI